jgi:phage tail sheath gpL-like
MASAIYPKAKEGFLSGAINLTSDTIRAVMIDTGTYTYNTAHDFYNDLSGVVGTESGVFGTKTVTNGVFDAADISFTSVTGATVEAIVILQDTRNVATDRLIAFIDAATGLPVTPNGGDINVQFHASGIFTL